MDEKEHAPASERQTQNDVESASQPQVDLPPSGLPPGTEGDNVPDKISKSDRVMIWVTVVIALGTLVSAGAIVLQWREMVGGGRQTDQLISAANINAGAGSRFADSADKINAGLGQAVLQLQTQAAKMDAARKATQAASQKSINASIAIARSDQRAWVGFADPTFVINQKDPAKAEVRVVVLGKSPATDIITYAATLGFPRGHVLKPEDIAYPPSEVGISNGTVFPAGSFPRRETGDDPISDIDKAKVQLFIDGKYTLYFFGKVTYYDIFKIHHWTHFCYVVDKNLTTASPCTIYNDSDADSNERKK